MGEPKVSGVQGTAIHDLLEVDTTSPQERTLHACHDMLENILSIDPIEYAYHLLAAGFISSSDHSKMLLYSLTPTEKAIMLMAAVRERVKRHPSTIHNFLQILLEDKSNRDVVKVIAQKLESEEGLITMAIPEFKSVVSSTADPQLSKNDLTKIISLLQECSSKWREIGANLRFLPEELDSISERPSLFLTAPESYLQELLSQWLDRPTRYHPDPPTWGMLRQALEKANLEELAERVNKEMQTHAGAHKSLEWNQASQKHTATAATTESIDIAVKIKDLEHQFCQLRRQYQVELSRNEVSVEMLVESLTLLPIKLRVEYEKSISEVLPGLITKVTTTRKFMLHLNPLFSFIDYGLLGHLICEFGSDDLNQSMHKYESDIQTFMKETTIAELIDCLPGQREIPPNFEVLMAKIGNDVRHCTLEQIDHVRRRFCAELLLSKVVFCLIALEESN